MLSSIIDRLSAAGSIPRFAAVLLLASCAPRRTESRISGVCVQTHTAIQALNRTAKFELQVKSDQEYQLDVRTDDGQVIYGEFEGTRYWFRRSASDRINQLQVFPSTISTNLIADDYLVEAIALAVVPGISRNPAAALNSSDLFARPFLASTSVRSTSPPEAAAQEFEITGIFTNGQGNVLGHFMAPPLPLQAGSSATLRRYDPNRTIPPKDRILTTYQINFESVKHGAPASLFRDELPGVTRVIDWRVRTDAKTQQPAFYCITNSPWPLHSSIVFQQKVLQLKEAPKRTQEAHGN